MNHHLFVGVDGGATKCVVRVENAAGEVLGRTSSGPANIRISVNQAWQSINAALNNILQDLFISLNDKHYHFHIGMGLAGCEMVGAYQDFIHHTHAFDTLVVTSDSHTACLGAHGGKDGAIIIAGTGAVGFQIQRQRTTKVGGWGFPHDDQGGGAWIGLEAVKTTFQSLDGRLPQSDLGAAIFSYFDNDLDRFVSWSNQANSTTFASLAPIVVELAQQGDASAIAILQAAAGAIDVLGDALFAAQADQDTPLSCALVGGVVPFIEPYLGENLRQRLTPCLATPDAGAILLVRYYLANKRGFNG